ncbi:Argininosuccinate lyase [Phycisphaerae bacterium RAS1]|nr:Argininosuccinate lyase [Phycisphaerae bacterium RAS1]
MAERLWDKGRPLDELIHRFTVGDDPIWDLHLVEHDCAGSAAHARTLLKAGLLTPEETAALLAVLREIHAQAAQGRFAIPPELEDCHTTIEAELTRRCGPAGEKIHTGRSRNDQVATAMRLCLRHATLNLLQGAAELAIAALERIERDGRVDMPGYTHMQPAMPSSVGQWLHALVEALLEQLAAGRDLLARLDACPLGSGAGFGVPLHLDRAYSASLLGFSRVQRSPIDVQNSRGRLEKYFARFAADVAAAVEKLSCDLLLFTTAEFGFFKLPEAFTTGSSLMPQKRNPDVVELMRGRAARLRGRVVELEWIAGKLPSSYHRDLQLTKAPVFLAAQDAADLLAAATRVIAEFEICREKLAAGMRPELYATDAALRLVRSGVPFRRAYRQVADEFAAGSFREPAPDPAAPQPQFVGAELLSELRGELSDHVAAIARQMQRAAAAEHAVLHAAL